MTKVVIDTNVIVSAALSSNGASYGVVSLFADAEIEIYYSKEILEEYREVLAREHLRIPEDVQKAYLNEIETHGKLVNPAVSKIHMPDEDDRPFYDTAKEVNAIVVTQNIKDFPKDPTIIKPDQYLTEWRRLKHLEQHSVFMQLPLEYTDDELKQQRILELRKEQKWQNQHLKNIKPEL